jgi:AcrR family transcriptional regulator
VDGRRLRGEGTRERLLVAARELFGERGYEGTSIEAVLARAGVKRGALYHHFESKQALFDAVLERLVADAATALGEAVPPDAPPVECLRAGCTGWLRLAADPAVRRIVLLDAPAVLGWARWREVDERYVQPGLRYSLDGLAAEGRLPAAQVGQLAHMIVAAVNEVALGLEGHEGDEQALADGEAAVVTMLDRLAGV